MEKGGKVKEVIEWKVEGVGQREIESEGGT